MPAACLDGWTLFSMPSTPADLEYQAAARKGWLTGVTYHPFRTGKYEWVEAQGLQPMQGACGAENTFTTGFSLEESSAHSIDIGGIFNAPTAAEAAEIQVSYGYEVGSATGHASSVEQSVGPTECYEYMATAIVLKLQICRGWARDGVPWYELLAALAKPGSTDILFPIYSGLSCDKPVYLRGGLMICRRWCCLDRPEPTD